MSRPPSPSGSLNSNSWRHKSNDDYDDNNNNNNNDDDKYFYGNDSNDYEFDNDDDDDDEHKRLRPSDSMSSVQGLIPKDHDSNSHSNSNSGNRHSTVYKGVKHLFLGDNNSSSSSRPGFHRSSSSPGVSSTNPQRNSDQHQREREPIEGDLLNPESLSVIKAGLDEALGSDGKGTWLKDESSNNNNNNISPSSSKTDNLSMNTAYRSSLQDNGQKDPGLLEEGHGDQGSQHSASSPAKNLSTMMQSFSSRVASTRRPSNNNNNTSNSRPTSQDPTNPIQTDDKESTQTIETPYDSTDTLNDSHEPDPNNNVFNVQASDDEQDPEAVVKSVLCGKSLMIFPTSSKFRRACYRILKLPFIEPLMVVLILLQTVLLTLITAPNIFGQDVKFPLWGTWKDWVFLVIFILYTAEAGLKIIAFGLWDDSLEPGPKTLWSILFRQSKSKKNLHVGTGKRAPVVLQTFTSFVNYHDDDDDDRPQNIERAYLRSSWNRVDFLSIICYWLSLFLNIGDLENRKKFFILRMLSSLRILRLLNLTKGTSSVLRAMKKAAPLLANIAIFIIFFWYVH